MTRGSGPPVVFSRYSTTSLDDPRGNWDVYEWHDGETRAITDGGPVDADPQVDQDGSRVFSRHKTRFDGGDTWMRDEAGTIKPLTDTPWPEFDPVVTPDGSHMAWSEDESGNHQLMLHDIHHGQQTVAATEPGVDEMNPALGADSPRWPGRASTIAPARTTIPRSS